jgi:hypothetical protein
MDGFYLYGIVRFPPPLLRQILGLGERPVFLVLDEKLAALVSRSPLHPWPPDEPHLTLHEGVVEEVMGSRPILPVRFNTLFRSEESVIALLEERAEAFRSALERVAGKVEMGLRVLWDPPEEAEAATDQETGEGGPGTEYLHRRLNEERHLARFRAAGEKLIQELQTPFLPLAVERWLRRFPTERLLLTGAYLVDRDRVDTFREAIATAQQEFSRLRFLLTGPWPPYHFVNGAADETRDLLGP